MLKWQEINVMTFSLKVSFKRDIIVPLWYYILEYPRTLVYFFQSQKPSDHIVLSFSTFIILLIASLAIHISLLMFVFLMFDLYGEILEIGFSLPFRGDNHLLCFAFSTSLK